MGVAYPACFIDDGEGGHPPELEEFDLLPVKPGEPMLRVGYAGEGHPMSEPEIREAFSVLRSHGNDLGVTFGELRVFLVQLRHVPPAVRSGKAPVEHEDDVLFIFIVGEPYRLAGGVSRGKVGRGGAHPRF